MIKQLLLWISWFIKRGSMRYFFLIVIILISLSTYGCGGGVEEIYETAEFEELQENREHAIELYMEILERYPDSEYAKKARERLEVLRERG
jgi:outer membrane protein assembly factor BamD (BamD/ComL family)